MLELKLILAYQEWISGGNNQLWKIADKHGVERNSLSRFIKKNLKTILLR